MSLTVYQGTGTNATEIERNLDGNYYVYINELPGSATDALEGRKVEVRLSEELEERVRRNSRTPTPVALPPSLGDGESPIIVYIPAGQSRWYLQVHKNNLYSSYYQEEDDEIIARYTPLHKAVVRQTAEPRYGSLRHICIYRGDGVETPTEEEPEEEPAETREEEEEEVEVEKEPAETREEEEEEVEVEEDVERREFERVVPPATAELEPDDFVIDRRRLIMHFKFTTSSCGGDQYEVIFQYGFAERDDMVSEKVTIVVRKRITYHYVEARTAAEAEARHYSLETGFGVNILELAIERLREDYGIELVAHGTGTQQGPYRSILTGAQPGPNHSLRGYVIDNAGLSQSSPPDREIWIVAGPSLKINYEDSDEMGGVAQVNIAAVNCHMYENMSGIPDEISNQVLAVLLHEIGHNFGLVPTDQEAGGIEQRAWREHGPHCHNGSCIMYYRTESVSSLLRVFSQDARYCGRRSELSPFDFRSRCALYLKTCDLTNIRDIFP
ncbi:MAG: hypothetical protein IMF13_07080 [Proteobacteria bacterium]|nr:hypothetical protein [Pseudomonadota bacterium]